MAFGELVRKYARTAVVLALVHVPDPDLAEDVAQDALIRAWTSLGECKEPRRFGSWLRTIVRRTALNARTRVHRRQGLRELYPADLAAASTSRQRSPEDRLASVQLRHALSAAIQTLPTRQREVLLLCDLEGRTHSEVAELMGITAATSRKHLSEARSRVRDQLTVDWR